MKKYVRLNLDVSPDLNNKLEDIAMQLDIHKVDVLRKGIALMMVAAEAKKNGERLVVSNGDHILKEIIGI